MEYQDNDELPVLDAVTQRLDLFEKKLDDPLNSYDLKLNAALEISGRPRAATMLWWFWRDRTGRDLDARRCRRISKIVCNVWMLVVGWVEGFLHKPHLDARQMPADSF